MKTATAPTPQPHDEPVSVRWLNPIGLPTFDKPIADLLHGIKQPSTRIEVVSFDMKPSPTHLEYRTYEALTYGPTLRIARDCAQQNIDALVIGCFYDPALEDAREISADCLVVGPCQASLQVAAQLANRFSIIVGRDKWMEQMRARVRGYGAADRLASMRALGMGVDEFQKTPPSPDAVLLNRPSWQLRKTAPKPSFWVAPSSSVSSNRFSVKSAYRSSTLSWRPSKWPKPWLA